MFTLSEELARRGYEVDLVTFDARGEFAEKVPENVKLYDLRSLGVISAARKISEYLSARSPSAIIANGDRCALASFLARKPRPRESARIIAVVHHDLTGVLGLRGASVKDRFLAWVKKFPMSRVYKRIDGIVAVSEGAAASVVNFLGVPRDKVSVIVVLLDSRIYYFMSRFFKQIKQIIVYEPVRVHISVSGVSVPFFLFKV
jgi:glycosyltransferase involved in cell wall biosynthesis